MHLLEPVLRSYRKHFRDVHATVASTLHAVLDHPGQRDDELWHLLNRIIDWRPRDGATLLEPDRFVLAPSLLKSIDPIGPSLASGVAGTASL